MDAADNRLPALTSAVSIEPAQENAAYKIAQMRHDPEAIRLAFETGDYPYKSKIRAKIYEQHKAELQVELLKVQDWVKETGQKIVVLFEGRDAAGKGGTIKRFMEHLNPRGARVVALEKPTERERTQWYFQRYIEHLPTGRRDRAVRPLLVQPGRRRARHGILHARTSISNSCASARSSSA